MNINENEEHSKTFDQIADEAFGPGKPKVKRADLFSKSPHWVVDTGVLAVLQPKGFKIYGVLLRFADFTTGIGRISNKTKARHSDVNIKSISGYMKTLEHLGTIKTWRKGWVKYYKILPTPPSNIKELVSFYSKDKYPKNMDTYQRETCSGRFKKRESNKSVPTNLESGYP